VEPERFEQIASLYEQASELEPTEREAFLAQASVGDEQLRLEVESLLRQDVSEGSVLERVAEEAVLVVSRSPSSATLRVPPRLVDIASWR